MLGEAASLNIDDWRNRNAWLDAKMPIPTSYSVTFVMGKGTRLVPIFFPGECIKAIDLRFQ